MSQALFTPLASNDVQQIWDYIANESDEEAADRFILKIDHKCKSISQNPLAYRERPELLPGLRSYPFKRYVIFNLPVDDGIEVIRVLHAARDIDHIFLADDD